MLKYYYEQSKEALVDFRVPLAFFLQMSREGGAAFH
jgi:hypothetical protein